MRGFFSFLLISLFILVSCDKVENPIPVDSSSGSSTCGWSAYPDGDSAHYAANAWPTFSPNTNTDRNILIEDFTGHKCIFCPPAAILGHELQEANVGRVFVSSIHAGPTGYMESNQQPYPTGDYFNDFTTPEGFAIAYKFGSGLAGSPFNGNPNGTVSRIDHGNGYATTHPSAWVSAVNSMIATNELKVNIQAASNYYPSTRGLFLHTEVDILDPTITNELRIVVYVIEDSLVAPQATTAPINDIYDFVHRDILRGCIDGKPFGQKLDASNLGANGKYYVNYIYCLPAQYNSENMHLLIYVRDAVTEEIYQVIKHEF